MDIKKVKLFLQDELDHSQFPIRTGKHIETRLVELILVCLEPKGRGRRSVDEIQMYIEHGTCSNYEDYVIRGQIWVERRFPELNVQIGGQTGLDISNVDKYEYSEILILQMKSIFFGDMMAEGENDYPLAKAVEEKTVLRTTLKHHRDCFFRLMEL